jgi:hypothetical protein
VSGAAISKIAAPPRDCDRLAKIMLLGRSWSCLLLDNLRGTGRYSESTTSTPLDLCVAFEAVADLNGR